jgi:hypothetical protein
MRHKIANIQVLTKLCSVIVGIYDNLSITQIASGSFLQNKYRCHFELHSADLSSIDCSILNTFACFITHEYD